MSVLICGMCEGEMKNEEVFCNGCDEYLHFSCSISEATHRAKSERGKKNWRCAKCRTSGNTVNQVNPPNPLATALQEINRKIDTLNGSMNEIKTTIDFLSNKYDEVIEEIKDLKVIKEEMKKKMEKVNSVIHKVIELEQQLLDKNLEISGVKLGTESLSEKHIVDFFSKVCGEKINESVVDEVYGINNTNRQKLKVIVKFNSKKIRDKILNCKRKKIQNKDLFKNGDDQPLYINENLTPYNTNLLWKAKNKAREKNYKFSWVKNGKVLIRKNEGSNVIRIRCEEDLEQIN